MVSKTDHRYPKSARVRKRSRYLEVQGVGEKVHSRGFLGIILMRDVEGGARLGVTVTKRVGTAVTRNRLKRLVKEAFRTGEMPAPRGADVVVVAKGAAAEMTNAAIFSDLRSLGKRALRRRGDVK